MPDVLSGGVAKPDTLKVHNPSNTSVGFATYIGL